MSDSRVTLHPLAGESVLAEGVLLDDHLVVCPWTDELRNHPRVRARFADGTGVEGFVHRHEDLAGVDLDDDGPLPAQPVVLDGVREVTYDPLSYTEDAGSIAQIRQLVSAFLGRTPTEARELVATPDSASAALEAHGGRVRSPFCWLFPRSRFCR